MSRMFPLIWSSAELGSTEIINTIEINSIKPIFYVVRLTMMKEVVVNFLAIISRI